jgi:hypothetical protein
MNISERVHKLSVFRRSSNNFYSQKLKFSSSQAPAGAHHLIAGDHKVLPVVISGNNTSAETVLTVVKNSVHISHPEGITIRLILPDNCRVAAE